MYLADFFVSGSLIQCDYGLLFRRQFNIFGSKQPNNTFYVCVSMFGIAVGGGSYNGGGGAIGNGSGLMLLLVMWWCGPFDISQELMCMTVILRR